LGFVGRFAAKKRIDVIVQASADLARAGFRHRLALAGQPTPEIELLVHKLSVELGSLWAVDLPGELHATELTEFYDALTVFLLPSEDENFGLAIAEALCRGVPVVVSRHVALESDIREYGAGLVINSLVPDAVSAAVMSIVETAEVYGDYSAKALKLAEERLRWSGVIDAWIGVLGAYAAPCA
jgi:glycosyltransferase involved in cell wall biosynthesis